MVRHQFSPMKFPRCGLDATKLIPDAKFVIGRPSDEDRAFWRNAKNSLLANPKASIKLPTSK
jgi:hypothetical protein